jgi:SAM-dependent methyltransferase
MVNGTGRDIPAEASRNLAAEYAAKAEAYEEVWAPFLQPLATPLLAALPLARARTIVDIGTGSGTNLPALRAAAPHAAIHGVDYVPAMLRVARRHAGVPLAAMDGQHLALADSSADVALMVFMLFHLPDPIAGLREARRVLRPGGFVGIVTWGVEPNLPGIGIWNEELDAAGAAPDPRSPIVTRQPTMNTPDKLAPIMEAAGLRSIRTWTRTWEQVWDLEQLQEILVNVAMPGRRLVSLAPGERVACEERARRRIARLSEEERTYRPEILYAVAER